MSLGRKTLLIASLALAGLGGVLYAALASILSQNVQDEMMVSYLAVSVVVAGGGFFLVTLLLMHKLVLTRLARLNAAISSISASGDFSKRLEIDGRDELASLAFEINTLLATLPALPRLVQSANSEAAPGPHALASLQPEENSQVKTPDPSEGSRIIPLPMAAMARGHSGSDEGGDGDSGRLFREIFRTAPVALAIGSADGGRFTEVNDSFLTLVGLSREKVLGRTFADLEIWADAPMRERWMRLLAEQQSVREFDCGLRSPSGEPRQTVASVEWLNLDEDRCFLFAASDITGRLNQELLLRQTHKMEAVGQLSAGFAHDFNNILAIVQGYTSILLSDKGLEPQANKALKEVSAAADRAANLTRQLLIFSRKQIMQPKTLDLNRLLQGLENTLQRLLGESSAVKFNLSQHTPSVRADAAMMEQAIVNLAVNARESMPRGGHFSIATAQVEINQKDLEQKPERRAGRFSCLTVVDTGCGFDPANLNRLFEPFFSAKGKGMGMGLATVYGIVKQHNGWIEVTSQPGQGTTFKIFLPGEIKPAQTVKTPPPGVSGGDERILLVEDEPGLCVMVESILRRYGYTVFTAPHGIEALQLWKQQKGQFDLLLTDMVMPEGVTGQQLAEKLKAQNPALKVIYSSGYSADLVSEEGIDLCEGQNFLQKPYHPQKLAQTVRNCLDAAVESQPVLAEATV